MVLISVIPVKRREKNTGVSRLTNTEIEAGNSYVKCQDCHSRVTISTQYSIDDSIYGGKSFSMPLKGKIAISLLVYGCL